MDDTIRLRKVSSSVVPVMEMKHPYIPISVETEREMLKAIGKNDIEELFCNVPSEFRLKRDLKIPDSHSEYEITSRIRELAEKNVPADSGKVFLGGAANLHYIPQLVPNLAGRSEFLTSYTSYQPEVSQGMLQTLFEYQSLLAEILEIDVVNSSMYDMATGLGEAARMATRVVRNRHKFLVPSTINPEHYDVLITYTEPADIEIIKVDNDPSTGLLNTNDLKSKLDDTVAGVYIENPSYLGYIESQVDEINKIVHEAGALFVVGVDILSLGILRPPGEYGADIVIAEGQPLGSPMSFGGPLLGIFGCIMDRKLVYQLPGRLVGMTRTVEEPYERGFVLTLSPREQHIRREKATSNICSNQALAAVTAAIYMSTLGTDGFKNLSETIAYKSNYTAMRLNELPGVKSPAIGASIWKDFTVQFSNGVTSEYVYGELLKKGIQFGVPLDMDLPWVKNMLHLSVTEFHSMEQIDQLVVAVKEVLSKGGGQK